VPKLPRIANFDDFDPLALEPDVELVFCPPGSALPGDAALIILPGSKATISDLRFLKQQGWDIDIQAHVRRGGHVLGICGGYQMLGHWVHDPDGIEGAVDREPGLRLLDVETVLEAEKTTLDVTATAADFDRSLTGYEIHVGRTDAGGDVRPWLYRESRVIGHADPDGRVLGGYLHGLFGNDDFRRYYLNTLGVVADDSLNFTATVDSALDDLAAAMEQHLDIDGLLETAGL